MDMDTNEKLIDDVKLALRTAGYGNIVSSASDPGVVVSAERGTAGAVFYLTPQIAGKSALSSTATGGRHAGGDKEYAVVVPVIPGVGDLMAADPARAATLLGISADRVRSVLRQTVR
jgi:hypothetical protein